MTKAGGKASDSAYFPSVNFGGMIPAVNLQCASVSQDYNQAWRNGIVARIVSAVDFEGDILVTTFNLQAFPKDISKHGGAAS